MLKKILESTLGKMSSTQFAEILDLATTDIKINRVDFGRKTSLVDAVEIAWICSVALQRGVISC